MNDLVQDFLPSKSPETREPNSEVVIAGILQIYFSVPYKKETRMPSSY